MSDVRSPVRPSISRRDVLGVVLFLCGLFALTAPGALNAVDTWRCLGEAAAIVEQGTLRFDDLDPDVVGRDIERALQPVSQARRIGVCKYGIAHQAAYVPVYLASKAAAAVLGERPLDVAPFVSAFVNPLAGALLGGFLLATLGHLGFSRPAGLLATGCVGVGSFLWPATGVSYGDPYQAAAVAAVLLAAVRARVRGTAVDLALLGAACAFSVLTKSANAPITAVLALVAMRDRTSFLRVALHLAPWALGAVAVHGLVAWARFGDPLESGYTETLFGHTAVLEGLRILFVSPARGLLWFFPVFPLGVVGLLLGLRAGHRLPWPLLAAVPVHVAVYVTFQDVHGGHCLGPRYLLVLLPVLAVGLAHAADTILRRRRALLAGALVASALWVLPMTAVQYFTYEIARGEIRNRIGHAARPLYPVAAWRLLLAKSRAGPDDLPLASFCPPDAPPDVRAARLVLSDWDNSGWAWWWAKAHPKLPALLRIAGVLALSGLAGAGVVLLVRTRGDADDAGHSDAVASS